MTGEEALHLEMLEEARRNLQRDLGRKFVMVVFGEAHHGDLLALLALKSILSVGYLPSYEARYHILGPRNPSHPCCVW